MVLVAFMLIVLIGFIGLAVDGGRLYWERRILQNSVDAAALAASDNYQDSQSISASMHSAAVEYAANERIYGTASASPSWSASSVDVTWSGSTDSMHVVYTAAGAVSAFGVSSTHHVGLAFIVVLGVGSTANVSALAEGHAKTGGVTGDALVTLSTVSCSGGAGDSLKVQGGGSQLVVTGGNVQTNGSVTAGGSGISVGGNFADNCTSPVPAGVTATGTKTAGAAPVSDPAFSSGPLASYSTAQSAGANVVLSPGVYASDPSSSSANCYFMAPGIYQLNGGLNDNTTDMSNELKPPDEPAWSGGAPNYNNSVASPQFWSNCPGSFSIAAAASVLPLAQGSWGAIVTSTRTETYPVGSATTYPRESAPSTCHAAAVNGTTQGVRVTINNAPGAQGYNIYLAFSPGVGANGCNGTKWGYVGHVANGVTETQASLGTVTSPIYDTTTITSLLNSAAIGQACVLGATYTFGCAAATGQFGSANPPGDGGETAPPYASGPPGPVARDIVLDGGGDRANEHQCDPSTSTDPVAPCIGAQVTPGAVQVYFPAGACLRQTGKTITWFAGFQFNNIAVYAPATNTCTVTMSGRASFGIGTVYWPKGDWNVSGNGGAPFASQVIVNTFNAQGNGVLIIAYDQQSAPSQGYSQISN